MVAERIWEFGHQKNCESDGTVSDFELVVRVFGSVIANDLRFSNRPPRSGCFPSLVFSGEYDKPIKLRKEKFAV
jgi:hypothetical protein